MQALLLLPHERCATCEQIRSPPTPLLPPTPRRPKLASDFASLVAPSPDLRARAVPAFQTLVDALLARPESRAHHRRRRHTSDSGGGGGGGSAPGGGGMLLGREEQQQQHNHGGMQRGGGWDEGEDMEEREEEGALWEREAGLAVAAGAAAFAVSGPNGFFFQRVIEVSVPLLHRTRRAL